MDDMIIRGIGIIWASMFLVGALWYLLKRQ